MITSNYSAMNDNPQRKIEGKVELFSGSTSLHTFLATDKLQEITVNRVGEKGKFFGFGICQQAIVKVVDRAGTINCIKGNKIQTSFRANNDSGAYTRVCPSFYIKDAVRDEKTNVITITAYDALDASITRIFSELGLVAPYTIADVIRAVKTLLGLSGVSYPEGFNTEYEKGANLTGNETIRSVLNSIAEVTQTIYFIDDSENLVFKLLDQTSDPVLTISKKDYFELTTGLPATISKLMSVTELGDNVHAGDDSGVIQYIRDNPFWDLREDLNVLLTESINRIAGLTIVPYNLNWRGNFLTEVCDKVKIETKDGSFINTFILDDSFTYNGGFSQKSDWEYKPEGDRATSSNPVSLGEKLNQTFARVDKAARTVTLYASELADTKSNVSQLQVSTQGIIQSVSAVEKQITTLDGEIDEVSGQANARIDTLSSDVALKLDKHGVEITVEKKLEEGVEKVVTSSKKYSFDDAGLNVSSGDSEISTRILEDGMRIYKNSQEVLTVDNTGVKAADLHAVTFLLIGENSRLEDRGNRTACFWIGPAGG